MFSRTKRLQIQLDQKKNLLKDHQDFIANLAIIYPVIIDNNRMVSYSSSSRDSIFLYDYRVDDVNKVAETLSHQEKNQKEINRLLSEFLQQGTAKKSTS